MLTDLRNEKSGIFKTQLLRAGHLSYNTGSKQLKDRLIWLIDIGHQGHNNSHILIGQWEGLSSKWLFDKVYMKIWWSWKLRGMIGMVVGFQLPYTNNVVRAAIFVSAWESRKAKLKIMKVVVALTPYYSQIFYHNVNTTKVSLMKLAKL